jgi:hypothetical protein
MPASFGGAGRTEGNVGRPAALAGLRAADDVVGPYGRRDEYEAARSQPTLFLIAPDHELQSERLLERNERYVVAEKVGEAAAIAQRHDPHA